MDIKQLKEEINKLIDQLDKDSELTQLKQKIDDLERRIVQLESNRWITLPQSIPTTPTPDNVKWPTVTWCDSNTIKQYKSYNDELTNSDGSITHVSINDN